MQDKEQGDVAIEARRRWIGVLSRARREELEQAADQVSLPDYRVIRGPEPGLVMLRGRAGGSGSPFNFGEATVTRCSVSLGDGATGHAYVLGRDLRHAELAAVFDAMLQGEDGGGGLHATVIDPISRRIAADRDATARKTAATKVDFFTVARGED